MTITCGIAATGYPTPMTEPTTNGARLAARPIHEGGTPVEEWTRWQPDFAALDVGSCPALVLVAAHPDDETLGLGGTAALLSDRGVEVQVVSATDGEAAYREHGRSRQQLAQVRRGELAAATRRLGLPKPIFLGLPDGDVATHEQRLSIRLSAVLAGFERGAWCAATWTGDGHPDHEATGRAARAAAASAGAVFLEYPIWMWHWATPDDAAVPWHRARRLPVTPAELARKADAMRCFASQLQRDGGPPVLTTEVVDRQMTVGEIVFV
jgi:LmbE family N-acetylglucosaminyl deacetylase